MCRLPVSAGAVQETEPNAMNDRNIVVTGVPRSGTTITTQMLGGLFGRDLSYCVRFAEHRGCRRINWAMRDGADPVARGFTEEAKALLTTLPGPWLVKDPWFCAHRDFWFPVFADFEPVLVLVRRETEDLWRTHKHHVDAWLGTLTFDQWISRREEFYDSWPFPKIAVDYHKIGAAANLWRNPKPVGG